MRLVTWLWSGHVFFLYAVQHGSEGRVGRQGGLAIFFLLGMDVLLLVL